MDNIAHARAQALQLIEQHGIKTAPVPIERIARALGVKVQYAPFDGELSGMAFIKDGVPIIGVNSLHHPNRQRFTLAHELAHIQLHRDQLENAVHVDKGSLRRDLLSAAGTDSTEREANAFAAELLMPPALLAAALDGRTLDLENEELVAGLAKRFRVSTMALQHRLQNE
jgi:Zn-dependent peptidase ImmA (M78 family)